MIYYLYEIPNIHLSTVNSNIHNFSIFLLPLGNLIQKRSRLAPFLALCVTTISLAPLTASLAWHRVSL